MNRIKEAEGSAQQRPRGGAVFGKGGGPAPVQDLSPDDVQGALPPEGQAQGDLCVLRQEERTVGGVDKHVFPPRLKAAGTPGHGVPALAGIGKAKVALAPGDGGVDAEAQESAPPALNAPDAALRRTYPAGGGAPQARCRGVDIVVRSGVGLQEAPDERRVRRLEDAEGIHGQSYRWQAVKCPGSTSL